MQRLHCLPPVLSESTHTLVVGTFPGVESLKKREYYANRKNCFWDIMFRVFDKNWDNFIAVDGNIAYPAKIELLLDNGLGLWDIIESCNRKGSSDKAISNATYNKISVLLQSYPTIQKLIFTKSSLVHFNRSGEAAGCRCKVAVLNSTSSLNPNNPFSILAEWRCELLTR